jgi:hypothetical protein
MVAKGPENLELLLDYRAASGQSASGDPANEPIEIADGVSKRFADCSTDELRDAVDRLRRRRGDSTASSSADFRRDLVMRSPCP